MKQPDLYYFETIRMTFYLRVTVLDVVPVITSVTILDVAHVTKNCAISWDKACYRTHDITPESSKTGKTDQYTLCFLSVAFVEYFVNEDIIGKGRDCHKE